MSDRPGYLLSRIHRLPTTSTLQNGIFSNLGSMGSSCLDLIGSDKQFKLLSVTGSLDLFCFEHQSKKCLKQVRRQTEALAKVTSGGEARRHIVQATKMVFLDDTSVWVWLCGGVEEALRLAAD